MEPTLQEGDVVLIRKSDPGYFAHFMFGFPPLNDDTISTARLRTVEKLQGTASVPSSPPVLFSGLWYSCPPIALPGQVVVYQDPEVFPPNLCVKRVVGVSGQWMMTQTMKNSTGTTTDATAKYPEARRGFNVIPGYSIYVEGDNTGRSRDSRAFGPLSKNLLVGVAEYIIWPPSRWQRIERKIPLDDNGKARAFWP